MIHLYEDSLGARFLYAEEGTHLYWAWPGIGPMATFDVECQAVEAGQYEEAREDILTPAEVLADARHLAIWHQPGVWGMDLSLQPSQELLRYLYGPAHQLSGRTHANPHLC